MRVLIDSHTLIGAVDDPTQLSAAAATTLQDPGNELVVSAATVWELAIKTALCKLTLSTSFRDWMEQAIRDLGLTLLPITVEFADAQIGLPFHHRDPFDRMLIAQALTEAMPTVSADVQFDPYGVNRVW